MVCRVCGEDELRQLHWPDAPAGEVDAWFRCLYCGSDTSTFLYAAVKDDYGNGYIEKVVELLGSDEAMLESMRTNLDWFGEPNGSNDFLDVGCGSGHGLTGMQRRGWSVHGFEVYTPPYAGPHVTIADKFDAKLFPQQYDAVLCREVLEHIEDWRGMLKQLFAVTKPGGTCQVQTPRPWHSFDPIPYQKYHLQLFNPAVLKREMEIVGFEIAGRLLWTFGQAWLCRRPK